MPPISDKQLQQRRMVRDNIDDMSNSMTALCTHFFTHLFRLDPSQIQVFDGGPVFLHRKFSSMMATFKNARRLESMATAIEALSYRHIRYGMKVIYLPAFKQALMLALADHLKDKLSTELRDAWGAVYDDITNIMKSAAENNSEWHKDEKKFHDSHHDTGLLEDIGGQEIITRVHQCFYDLMFDDDWIGQFFLGKHKLGLIRKQTEFMVAAFGGPSLYSGQPPALVHMHMYITEDMALYREKILRKCILDAGLSAAIADRWLAVDRSFWPSINKQSLDECVTPCPGQLPITIKPRHGHNT
ncbi:MAG: hypothetical protein Q9M20_05900 [Mariprofundaceae bacterium]|nr:hypothetical protein [Mariprofundaceae bacterium]